MARAAQHTVRRGGVVVDVDRVDFQIGPAIESGAVSGLTGSVQWADPAPVTTPQHPAQGDYDRPAGTAVHIDWTDHHGTIRACTARVDDTAGEGAGSTSRLTDDTLRLETEVSLRPMAWTMPKHPIGQARRSFGLHGVWFTHQALMRSGWHTCHGLQRSAVAYHSMCGSSASASDPDSTYAPLSQVTAAGRMAAYGSYDPALAPVAVQGDDMTCMEQVYLLGFTRTRRRNSSEPWQVTVDLGTRTAPSSQNGRVTLRPERSSTGAAIRLDWTQTAMRVYRRNTDGTNVLLGSYPRAVNGAYTMRWTLTARANGTAVLRGSDGRGVVATLTNTGVTSLPTDSGRASYLVESPGMISAVSICRADDAPFLVTQPVGARILRSSLTGTSMAAWGYTPPRQAGGLLAEQAQAERGWKGLPLLQWIDEDGRLINADFRALAARPVTHVLSTDAIDETAVDGHSWAAPGGGPVNEVVVKSTYWRPRLSDQPTILLGEGTRETIPRGSQLVQHIHPIGGADQTWLAIDTSMYLAGHPYPAPTDKEYDRQHGTWGGGHLVDVDGQPSGWVTVAHIPEWSMDDSGHVQGALTVLDPHTVLVTGTVSTPPGLDMSTLPSPASSGLPEHRKSQPLTQIRGTGEARAEAKTTTVEVSGDNRHPVHTHDGGAWISNPAYAERVAGDIAESYTDPALLLTARVALNPRVRVGDKIESRERYSTGWRRVITGVVLGKQVTLPSRDDVMPLLVAMTAHTLVAPDLPLPPPANDPPPPAPPRPVLTPPSPRPPSPIFPDPPDPMEA